MKKTIIFLALLECFTLSLAFFPFSTTNLYAKETSGFEITSGEANNLGMSVSNLGDINGDGIDDLIIGAPDANYNGRNDSGAVYVIYGNKAGFSNIDIKTLTSDQGFTIGGASAHDQLGSAVSSAGDLNGDGINDILIGAQNAAPKKRSGEGAAYVIYGSKSGFKDIDLASLTTAQGFYIAGAALSQYLGYCVNSAGDVNGDGLDDIVLVAAAASPLARVGAGVGYVIYGQKGGFNNIDLLFYDLTDGFKIYGVNEENNVYFVNGIGDINGDGFDDIGVGSPLADNSDFNWAGFAYVIYGSNEKIPTIDLKNWEEKYGFQILGPKIDASIGNTISNAGDVNGDNITDFIVGSTGGLAYIFYGNQEKQSDFNLSEKNLTSSQGFMITGSEDAYFGFVSSGAGDVNGDGLADVLISAPYEGDYPGAGYVVYGSKKERTVIEIEKMNDDEGFKFFGENNERLGWSASPAGDINNDGFADVIFGAPAFGPGGFPPGPGYGKVVLGGPKESDLSIIA